MKTMLALSLCQILFSFANVNTHNYQNDNLTTYNVKAYQNTYSDGYDVDTDINTVFTHEVNFEQKYKTIYLSNNDLIKANKLINSSKQTNVCTDKNDSGTCGGHNYQWDLKTRVHDWNNDLVDNLFLKNNDSSVSFGQSFANIYLKQKTLWNFHETYRSITCPIVFKDYYEHASDISFNVGFHRTFTSGNWSVYGLNKGWMKETKHVDVFWNWVDRFLWTLHSGASPSSAGQLPPNEVFLPLNVNSQIPINLFNINNMLSINGVSYKDKSIIVGLNNEYLSFIKKWHVFISGIKSWSKSDEEKRKKYHIEKNDDPWKIISDIQNLLYFNIRYEVSDNWKQDGFLTEQKACTFNDLLNGVKIYLNTNNTNEYFFKFLDAATNEVNNERIFLQSSSTSNIVSNGIFECDKNGYFKLNKPEIKTIKVKSYDKNSLCNVLASSISESDFWKNFIDVIDTYGEINNYSILEKNMYEIKYDDINGTIGVCVHYQNNIFYAMISGFKKCPLPNINELDASVISYNLIADDINVDCIKKLLLANGFNNIALSNINFNFKYKDNANGAASIIITQGILKDKIFNIKNLCPYFIDLKQHINNSAKHIKPSEVTVRYMVNNFIEISNEFYKRNANNIEYTLTPVDKEHRLLIHINVYNLNLKYDFEVNGLKNISIFSDKLIVIVLVMGVLACFVFFYFLYKKLINKSKKPIID